MIKKILSVLLVFGSLKCASQALDSFNRLAFKFSPLALFNANTACVQTGFEFWFLPKWSIQSEYGLQFEELAVMDWNQKRLDWKYHKLKGELRHYLPIGNKKRSFIGIEYFNVQQDYTKIQGLLYVEEGPVYSYDKSVISRDSWGLLGKIGGRFWDTKHFFGEIVLGLGYKKVSIQHRLENLVELPDPPIEEFSFEKDKRSGVWNLPYASYEIKFGYQFWKNKK